MKTKQWAISKKNNVMLDINSNTTASRYPVSSFKAFRKFSTREAARAFKRSQKVPSNYCIVNTNQLMAVR